MTGGIFASGIFPAGIFPSGIFPRTLSAYPSVRYSWEENEMYEQFTGETVKWTFQVIDSSGAVVESLTAPVVNVRLNGETLSIQTWTISEFNSTMGTFLLEVPPTLDGVALDSGDILEIAIVDAGVGRGHISIKFVSEISGGGGAEKVIPRTYYELSAAANTITLSSPYDTITEEQILSICDLTTGDVIYSCDIPIKHTISVSSGVITFTYDNNSIAAEDILQIIVNQV